MKKTVLTSTLALGLGVTGLATGHHASAAETTGADHAQLAQLAQNNPSQLDAKPVQEGSYNISFTQNGTSYHFSSNGKSWTWGFGGGSDQSSNSEQAQPQQKQQTEQTQQPKQQQAPQTEQTQQGAQQTQQQEQPKQQQAPQTEQTQQESTSSSSNSSSSDDSGSSVNVNSHLQQIAQRESGGDIHATNASSGASGKYQFLQTTWDSVAPSQYQGQPASSAPESVQDAAAVKLYNSAGASQWVTA
ncbi:transglycosylase family protein [Staphylococcus durrellii]|uniref:transglycosylase family protein n=1 Tax=Staphylococcus durrellii TaxID=2781773 RepID=UPI0018A03A2A|nr:transglycosylase family protein [Staphylococcus durrellii]MBF7016012.1 transglycosylase family protein [Staphylococcus durrellii]